MPGEDPPKQMNVGAVFEPIPDAEDSVLWRKINNMSTNTPEFDKMTEKEILFRILQTLMRMELDLEKIEAYSELTAARP